MVNKDRYAIQEVVQALTKSRGIKAIAAHGLGCSRQTIDNYINRHPEIMRVYQEQRQTLIDVAEGQLVKKLDQGEWPAIKFVLTTLGRNRGYVERKELMGAFVTANLQEMPREELVEFVVSRLAPPDSDAAEEPTDSAD